MSQGSTKNHRMPNRYDPHKRNVPKAVRNPMHRMTKAQRAAYKAGTPEVVVEDKILTKTDLEAMNTHDLRALCKQRGIKVTTKFRKAQLIECLGFR